MPRNTNATNTTSSYGWVERAFHWAIALLIVTALVLSKVAEEIGTGTDAELAQKVWVYSFHKTIGVSVFFVAVGRILWAVSQPRPRPLHQGWEAQLAAVVHWMLYSSLVLVPLLGWTAHAASSGFAEIWWPFGQGLPGIPKSAELSETLFGLHTVFVILLLGSLILHILGAMKHAVLDRDQTFARMWNGTDPGALAGDRGHALPFVGAMMIWGLTLSVGLFLIPGEEQAGASESAQADVPSVAAEAADSNWTVEEGTLSITVTQLGSPVTGSFKDWQANIDFDETPRADGTNGTVEVSVATGSLTLGSVTGQATGEEFLAAGQFPTALYAAVIRPDGDGYIADGRLSLRGADVALQIPFTLAFEGDTATMAGQAALDRRDFGMGETYPDESSVGFGVKLDIELTAVRTQ
ncbi:cytochrome b/b6 domain-containing protein [Jannaschia faecimaris]|nr:cytochrome b/b6 domain-containing protein [Jannaschia faecimaris]